MLKKITQLMGHLFQAECWAIHHRGCSFSYLWLRKLENGKAKALESRNGIFGTIIYENNGN